MNANVFFIISDQIDGDTGEKQTVTEIRQRTMRCAQHLIKLGCTQDQRIAIIARNHHNLTPLIFSAFCIGSPITPMDVIIVNGIDKISNVRDYLLITKLFNIYSRTN